MEHSLTTPVPEALVDEAANDALPVVDDAPACTVIEIGRSALGATEIELGRLLRTRLLIQAGSGGGKSWCLRRFIEQAYGKVRIIVFDPEGELVTLADQFAFAVCAPDSETNPIFPAAGAAAARAIYLSRQSTILSLSEFDGLEQMQRFVADFCRELLRMPPESWHHVLLVFDEAQLFAGQHEKSVSKQPMVDLARRGRKRGMCPVVATPRLSELSKGVASHLENKMIGLTSLELDIASAAKALGMQPSVARQALRRLPNGHFICNGPAVSSDLVETTVGPVLTRHGSLDEFRGIAAPVAMGMEALAELLKSARPALAAQTLEPDDEVDDEERGHSGQAKAANGGRRPRSRGHARSPSRRRRESASLARSFDIACEIVQGRQISEIAAEHQVTGQSVRNWLHAAVARIDLPAFGIALEPLRVDLLRASRHRVDTALRRAKLTLQQAASSSGAPAR